MGGYKFVEFALFRQRFSATTWVRILKSGTKLHSDELYCVTKKNNSHILLISPFIYLFSFLSNGNFCHRFLSSYWSQCFEILCPHFQEGKVYCVNGNKDSNSHFAFFFQFFIFSFFHSYKIHMDIFFCQRFLSNYLR